MKKHRIRVSRISALHYAKLVFRSALLLLAILLYIRERTRYPFTFAAEEMKHSLLLAFIWAVFAVEMLFRFFPSSLESMGCQKQFRKNYRPIPDAVPDRKRLDRGLGRVILFWAALNGAVGALYLLKLIDWGVLLLLSLTYSVCDMVCILFFCPFQTWFMKNKCCGSCRIYNWDYAMMFTPMLFVPAVYTWSLFAMGAALLIEWEVLYARHPERFDEASSAALRCENCPEKLCAHKKQLQRFLVEYRQLVRIPLPPAADRKQSRTK